MIVFAHKVASAADTPAIQDWS